jgi:hypothetical protein
MVYNTCSPSNMMMDMLESSWFQTASDLSYSGKYSGLFSPNNVLHDMTRYVQLIISIPCPNQTQTTLDNALCRALQTVQSDYVRSSKVADNLLR